MAIVGRKRQTELNPGASAIRNRGDLREVGIGAAAMSGRTQDEPAGGGPETSSPEGKLLGDDAGLEATSLEALENDFQEVLAELEGDKA